MIKEEFFAWFRLVGMLFMFGMFILLFITFLTAYNNPSNSVLVTINELGEAKSELVLLSMLFTLGISSVVLCFIDVYNFAVG